jgi:DNA-binding transcriptional LysR family regulator
MVEAGMGVALVPRMAAERRDGVLMRPLGTDRPRRHVLAAVRRGSESAPGVARVLDALREVASERTA